MADLLVHHLQKSTLRWSDPRSSYTLTKVLLHLFYGLSWQMDYNTHLVPMLGQRYNYLHWLMGQYNFYFGKGEGLKVMDVGCGVSLIFGLLAIKGFKASHVIGTDIE